MPDTTPVLDRLWDDLPTGDAPVGMLLERGQRAVRRRRRLTVSGVVLAVAVGVIGTSALLDRSPRPTVVGPADPTVEPTTEATTNQVAPGMRQVGINGVVVEVWKRWTDGDAPCNIPLRDTVYFPHEQGCIPPFKEQHFSSLALASDPSIDPSELYPSEEVSGYRVVDSGVTCEQSASVGVLNLTLCRQTFGIPDLAAYFTVSIAGGPLPGRGTHTALEMIRESLTVLGEDQVTVPFVPYPGPVDHVVEVMEAAGLRTTIEEKECPPTAACIQPGFWRSRPAAGSVVDAGSTVTLVMLWADTPPSGS